MEAGVSGGKMKISARRNFLAALACAVLFTWSALPLHADADDPPAVVGRLHAMQGNVSVQPADVDQWSQVAENYPVATGDRIYSDQDSRAEVQLGSMAVRLWQTTDLTFTNLADQLTQLGLAQGSIRVRTFSLNPGTQVEVDTPNGSLTVVQPGDFRVDSYTGDGGTVVTVISGQVQVTGPGVSEYINAGQSVQLEGTNPIQAASIQRPASDAFDSWCVERDQHILNAQSGQYVGRNVVGYDDLDGYGGWSNDADYGPVWYPSGVAVDWVPYRVGHWVWVGPWGWTWVEDEPWGYAPFHYGRWAFIGSRWGWVPGPIVAYPVWSPAFVAFAGGGGFSAGVAWFPLGPGEPFYPWYHCSTTYIRNINITNINITRIRNVTVVNNYNTFINHVNNLNDVHINYANRTRAFTAVNQSAFSSARPVNDNLVHINQAEVERAQVIPHPSISPTMAAKVPHPVSTVRVSTVRPTLLVQGGREEQARPGAPLQNVPRAQPPTPTPRPEQPRTGTNQPVQTGAPRENNLNQPQQPKPLITRSQPPPPQPTFEDKQKAMETHPGRPLEPQQIDNMRQGRPAGQPQDREWPAHTEQAPRQEAPRPSPHH
jgi:hypothetical protein